VIGALEDAEDYKAFEAAIIADYDAQSAVERLIGPSRRTGHLSKACWWIVSSQAERLTAEFAATSGWREDLNRSIDRVLV
jgi:hypothetical protein